MKTKKYRSTHTVLSLSLLSVLSVIGCSSGDGSGDDSGNSTSPAESSSPDVTIQDDAIPSEQISAFRQIQDTVFTPICAECHGSAGASAGLRLDDGASFAALVDVASSEVPELNRVSPGDPDNSYLVQKIEGTAAVGARMPLGGPMLPQESISLIRDWISAGALPESASPALAARVFSTSVDVDNVLPVLPAEMIIVFTEPVDESTVNPSSFSIMRSGGDNSFTEGNEVDIPFSVSTTNNGLIARLDTSGAETVNDAYQLRVHSNVANYILDFTGDRIDGDSNGIEGGDFNQQFVVESAL